MDFKQFPKVELHRHLELSIRHSTLRELAPQQGIELKNDDDFYNRFVILEPMKNLESVLDKFLDTQLLLSNEEILERITYEACEDAYNEGVRLLELRYAPTFLIYRHDNMNFEKIHRAIVKGKERAEKDFAMGIGLVCIIQRILTIEDAKNVTAFAIENKDSFVGLDLADNEVGFDSKPFAPFFEKAKAEGLGITVHSGEAPVPKAPRYIRDAIDYLGADRIGHGVQVHHDEEMMKYLIDKDIPLEICPTSNYLTQAVPNLKEHPVRKIMEYGVSVTLNTDDPGIFNTDMNKEYKILHEHQDFTEEEFTRCNDIAAKHCFLSDEIKKKFWPSLN